MNPAASLNTRRRQTRSASFPPTASSSEWVTPTKTHNPGPISPTTSPSTVTDARLTRWMSARIPDSVARTAAGNARLRKVPPHSAERRPCPGRRLRLVSLVGENYREEAVDRERVESKRKTLTAACMIAAPILFLASDSIWPVTSSEPKDMLADAINNTGRVYAATLLALAAM